MDGTEQELDSAISDAALFAAASEIDVPEIGGDAGPDIAAVPEREPQKEPKQVAAPEATPAPVAEQKQQEAEHRVPLRELLDEREKRQEASRQMAELQRQYAEMQRQMEALRNPQQPVDLLTDPQRFQETIEQRFERQQREFDQRIRLHGINTSFSFAARQHGEEFQKAFAALEEVAAPHKGGDTMLRDRIVNSPDPGEAVMQWYRSQQILRESGGDLTAYREKLLNEQKALLLKDPEFLAEAMKAARAAAQANPTIRPGNPTGLPSLTRKTAAASNDDGDDNDMSDGELFRTSLGRRR
ncbi:MAG: hypothetical protein ABFC96_01280 [Thermoguttaceae bacterium]